MHASPRLAIALLALIALSGTSYAQTYPITGINVSLPGNPDAKSLAAGAKQSGKQPAGAASVIYPPALSHGGNPTRNAGKIVEIIDEQSSAAKTKVTNDREKSTVLPGSASPGILNSNSSIGADAGSTLKANQPIITKDVDNLSEGIREGKPTGGNNGNTSSDQTRWIPVIPKPQDPAKPANKSSARDFGRFASKEMRPSDVSEPIAGPLTGTSSQSAAAKPTVPTPAITGATLGMSNVVVPPTPSPAIQAPLGGTGGAMSSGAMGRR